MNNYILIEPITYGIKDQYQANAIAWQVNGLSRNATSATAVCYLTNIEGDVVSRSNPEGTFKVPIDNATLQSWGADDTVIDNVVLAYSPKFILRDEE